MACVTPDPAAEPTGSATRPLRVVLCGEVSSGKSTVMNALLRRKLVPTTGIGEHRPRVIVAHRETAGRDVTLSNGSISVSDPGDTSHAAPMPPDAQKVVYWTDQSHLDGIEMTEIPLTTADALSDADRETIGAADVMIWLTIGSQAWRFTEKTIIDTLGTGRPPINLLVVSRSDKLRSAKDRAKLYDRLCRETSDYFDEIHFMHGAGRTIEMSDKSEQTWISTGAKSIFETLRIIRKDMRKKFPETEGDHDTGEVGDTGETTDTAEASETAEVVDLDAMRAPTADPAPLDEPSSEEVESAAPPEPEEQTDATSIDPSLIEAMQSVASETPGIELACFWTATAVDAPIASLVGEEDLCRTARAQCRGALDRLSSAYGLAGLDGAPDAVSIATTSKRICILPVHGGTLFFIADASRLSEGKAQAALRRFASDTVDAL